MITCNETSLNMIMIQVQAAEEKCMLAEQFLRDANRLCYTKADNVIQLIKQSTQEAKLDAIVLWQIKNEIEEAKRILEETIDKVEIAKNKLAIVEAEKKIVLEAFEAASKSTAELLFHENEQYIHKNYPEINPNKIKEILPNILRKRTINPYFSKRDIIGCMCNKIPCTINYSNNLTGIMPICEPSQDDCSICLEPLTTKQCVKTLCNHIFHRLCMSRTEKTYKFLPLCPLCRNHMCVLPQDSDEHQFLQLKQCNCCERHKLRRPRYFSSKAAFSYQCDNPLADILIELLYKYDNSISNSKCNCDCRKKMRLYCRILPNIMCIDVNALD